MYVLHKIEVAQAFDELSILEIKRVKSEDQKQKQCLKEQIRALKEEINNSIGRDFMKKIYHSNFYINLYCINYDIFKSVDKLNWAEAASFNMKRFEAKKALQTHFFGGNLKEIKI